MDQLISIINELQDTYSRLDIDFIDLPKIVIIGSQSSGKSSVLENIVGYDFLPRGTDIVTRCPLILQLFHESDSSKEARGQFLHTSDMYYNDFSGIKEEIIKQTDVIAGTGKNISDKPITLKIYSHKFPNLTLIDLPGLTQVAVKSQPRAIVEQIKSTCRKFASEENSIILAISTANVDLANSESLRFAEELDPEGKRTLCVVTKLDLMDRGTDAYEILKNQSHYKELGYIGVVCRSQEDITKGKPIEESLRDEREFFKKRYPDLAMKNGSDFLSKSLNLLLKKHIHKCLPSLKETINEKILKAEQDLERLGPETLDKTRLRSLLKTFNDVYININDGNFPQTLKEIQGGVLISIRIYEIFREELMKIEINNLSDDDILKRIAIANATDKMTFSRQKPFKNWVQEEIQKFLNPSLKCIEDVYEIMKDFVTHAITISFNSNLPNLVQRILEESDNLMRESYKETKELVEKMIKSESTDVMCSHPNFQLEFALENINFHHNKNLEDDNSGEGNGNSWTDNLLQLGFKFVLGNISGYLPLFIDTVVSMILKSQKAESVLNLFQNVDLTPENKHMKFGKILEKIFHSQPSFLEFKDVITEAVIDENNGIANAILQHQLKRRGNKVVKETANKDDECAILRVLVGKYFDMVRINICYYVPKLIKTFLVFRFRDELSAHLQMIGDDPNFETLFVGNESTELERKKIKELLRDLENVKNRINKIYRDNP